MDAEKLESLIAQYRLKDRIRSGWNLRGVQKPESVADHSWGTAHLCLIYAGDEGVDRRRVLEIALVHDLAEAETGDFPRRVRLEDQPVTTKEKAELELAAMNELGKTFPELQEIWWEYEEGGTPESRFVRDMNLVDMCLQALIYEQSGNYRDIDIGLLEFFATSEPRLSTDTGKRLFSSILVRYNAIRRQREM